MIIGLTGGVGSGKSTVLTILQDKYKAHIIEADKIAHTLITPGHNCYDVIVKEFGAKILSEDKTIDRKVLGSIVFKDKDKLEILNQIIHPAVKTEIKIKIKLIQDNDPKAIIVIEAALLIEAGYRDVCDSFWYISTEYPIRKQRLMESRGYTEEKIKGIIDNQLSDDEFKQMCDYVIDNSNSMEETLLQVEKIMLFYKY